MSGGTNDIARIDPQTGAVKGWIDLTGIQPGSGDLDDVLNGIAYDATADRLFVTGKRWPQIFQITLKPRP
ncbi:MAG: glutaminyl-peptide cyclotransferase [Armatimonas sp.]